MTEKNEIIDKHHISYEPPITIRIPHKLHQEIHGNVPIKTELNLMMRQYDKLVKFSVMLQNWKTSYEKEFGQNPIDVGLKEISDRKEDIMEVVKSIIKSDLEKVKHIKGLGVRYLGGLLAYAHPKRFPSLRRFLSYCGYKGNWKVTQKYSRKVKSLVHQIVVQMIMHKDKEYYTLYLKIKQDLSKKFPNYRKGKIDGMTKNRVGTFFLKEFWCTFNKAKKSNGRI